MLSPEQLLGYVIIFLDGACSMLLTYPSTSPASSRRSRTSARLVCHDIARLVAGEFGLDAAAIISPTRGAPHAALDRLVRHYGLHARAETSAHVRSGWQAMQGL